MQKRMRPELTDSQGLQCRWSTIQILSACDRRDGSALRVYFRLTRWQDPTAVVNLAATPRACKIECSTLFTLYFRWLPSYAAGPRIKLKGGMEG